MQTFASEHFSQFGNVSVHFTHNYFSVFAQVPGSSVGQSDTHFDKPLTTKELVQSIQTWSYTFTPYPVMNFNI